MQPTPERFATAAFSVAVVLGTTACNDGSVGFRGGQTTAEAVSSTFRRDSSAALPDVETRACHDPSAEDKAIVDELLAHPLPAYKKVEKESPEDSLWRLRKETAAKYDLTIFDPRAILEPYTQDLSNSYAGEIPIAEYQTMARNFLARYGVRLIQPTDTTPYGTSIIAPFSPDLIRHREDEYAAKKAYLQLINNIAPLPLEFVQQVGLSEVVVVQINLDQTGGLAEMGTKSKGYGRFYIDPIQSASSGRTSNHELSHLWDANRCSGVHDTNLDPAFVALNPNGAKTYVGRERSRQAAERNPSLSVENIVFSQPAKDVMNEWEVAKATVGYDEAKDQYFAAKFKALFANAVVTNWCGLATASEDKAIIGENILSLQGYSRMLSPDTPIVSQKTRLLLARLYHDNWRVMRYFYEAGYRRIS